MKKLLIILVMSAFAASCGAANLLVWINFEDNFGDGKIDDVSGNGRHAWEYGRNGTNYIVRVPVTTSPGARTNGYCGRSRWYNDGWGIYGRSGDYAGITTNVSVFTNMTSGVISMWVRYFSATNIDPTYTILNDQNAKVISAGTSAGKNGNWLFGRDYSANTVFTVITNDSAPTKVYSIINFPDGAAGSKGDTTNWHHYAISFANGRLTNYFDGAVVTNQSMHVPLTLGAFNGVQPWIGLGCDTHSGTPQMEDEVGEDYPNHGWFNGLMDDIRIYDGPMTSAEMSSVYASSDIISGPAYGYGVTARVGTVKWPGQ